MSIQKLKKLAREAELNVVVLPDRIEIQGGVAKVTFWPDSRRRTAYADGSPQGIRHPTPEEIINLAVNGYGHCYGY